MRDLKKYTGSLFMLTLFFAIGVTLSLALNNWFYLFNFGYIGSSVALGLALFANKKPYARHFTQAAVGLYMLVGLGFVGHENMQIEGFWYLLSLGVFSGATIHYAIAKIFGPALFGRGWCGYACWTAMVLDLLPYRECGPRIPRLGALRYVVLVGSFLLVAAVVALQIPDAEGFMFGAFIVGNLAYYVIGIALAFALKDNRAFCKYVCPVAVMMKPAAHFSLARVTCDHGKCVNCGKCAKICPMNVDMRDDSRWRANGTECILCLECVNGCPKQALKL